MADLLINHRRPRRFRRVNRQLTDMTDEELRRRYRFSSPSVDILVGLIGHRLHRPTNRNQALTPKQQVLVALRFYASGNFMQVIGDTFGIDIATVSRAVRDVTDALFDMKDRAITFPRTEREKNEVKAGLYEIRGFPGLIGCIDGTHVKILSPGRAQGQPYINRKHQHSINVQATCDHKGRFTSINSCWPGSCHDSHVLRCSGLGRFLEANHQDPESGILLGDSGYPCRPFLLTPYLRPATPQEERFNRAHIVTRNLIERTFGVWKRKFHVLHSEIRMKPHRASRVIVACAVLFNLAIDWQEPMEYAQDEEDEPDVEAYQGPQADGRGVRRYYTDTYFL